MMPLQIKGEKEDKEQAAAAAAATAARICSDWYNN